MAAVTVSATNILAAWPSVAASSQSSCRKDNNVKGSARSLNLYGGLKAVNKITGLGYSVSSEEKFADLQIQCRAKSGSKGGALCSRCDVASEILTVVPIMCALTLIGIALGFVLLRVEAAFEESQE